MKAGFGNLMKQAQKIQGQFGKIQEELAAMNVTGQSGGGMVEITLNGSQEAKAVRIDPTVVDPEDVEMLEDLILAAIHDAQKKVREMSAKRMADMTGGLNLPGMNFPFNV